VLLFDALYLIFLCCALFSSPGVRGVIVGPEMMRLNRFITGKWSHRIVILLCN